MQLRASPVKESALERGLEVLQPAKARDPELLERLEQMAPDVAVVVAYGSILPKTLLDVPPKGFVNVHFSLLPLYRGAAPVQRAVIEGRSETGVSIMVLTEGMDEGPVLARTATPIGDDDTAGSVGERLSAIGADLLVRTLSDYVDGDVAPEEQDHDLATYAPKITSEEAEIDWTRAVLQIRDHVRGMNPLPGAWTTLRGERLKVWAARVLPRTDLEPGELDAERHLVVGGADGALELTDVQLRGKRQMSGPDLANGLRLGSGERVGRS